ncbi:DUF4143 domain-containing protein [Candidatus Micrarchaeota archaeon]|nr:DUF4143 domain-containing protein [Candidatus Micrarchaeota archaeon]
MERNGKLFENYVFCELEKAGFDIKYWKSKSAAEVDFVIRKNGEQIPIKVKLFSDGKVERSLHSFIEKYTPAEAYVVFYKGEENEQQIGKTAVRFVKIDTLMKHLSK